MTLRFADISSHNAVLNWGTFLGSLDGLAVKITQGTTYAWSGAPNALAQARNAGKLVAAYHFAGNLVGSDTIPADPVAEANWFLAHYTHQPGEVIILDWEPTKAPADPDAWAYAFAQRVIATTGVVQWMYLDHFYASVQSSWTRTRSLGCGLWAAWYGINNGQPQPGIPSFAPWPSMAAWQYTSAGSAPGHAGALDLNYFYGTPDQWRAYGNGTAQEADLTPDEHTMLANVERMLGAVNAVSINLPVEQTIGYRVRDMQQTLAAQQQADPQAIADAVVKAIQAMPAANAAQVADLVITGLGQRINTPPAPA